MKLSTINSFILYNYTVSTFSAFCYVVLFSVLYCSLLFCSVLFCSVLFCIIIRHQLLRGICLYLSTHSILFSAFFWLVMFLIQTLKPLRCTIFKFFYFLPFYYWHKLSYFSFILFYFILFYLFSRY